MSEVNVLISVSEEYRDRILDVMGALQAEGFQVEQGMIEIGVITGSIDAEKVNSLAHIAGVAEVEQATSFQLAPPDSDVQ